MTQFRKNRAYLFASALAGVFAVTTVADISADARVARSRDAGKHWDYLEGGLPAHIRGNIEAMSMNAWPGGSSLFCGTTDGWPGRCLER